jgi:galactokinase
MIDCVRAFAPGRVNLIGEHTDYNDGLALPFAIEAGVTVIGQRLDGGSIEAVADDFGERDEFAAADPRPADGWRAFVRGAVGELRRAGVEVPGARLQISGDVPLGGGLSSSAALEVGLCLALLALAGAERPDPVSLARICSAVEHNWVGAQTGLLDQLASLCGERDRAVRIDFRSLELTPLPLELDGYQLVTLDSGERHVNAGSGYNERRDECAQACEALGIASLRDARLPEIERLPEPLSRRARHVVTENDRVDAAVEALRAGELEEVGRLLDASHRSLRDDYAVSTDAVEATVARLREAGAIGARIMGGGFGGSVLALLPPGAVPPDGAQAVRPGPGAHIAG